MRLSRLAALAATALTVTSLVTLAQSAGATTATTQVVLRPVTSAGHVAHGYTKTIEHAHGVVDCRGDEASTVAVNGGIFACAPSAAYAVACWHASLAHHVLCYQDPFRKQVRRFTDNAPKHAQFPREATAPFGLVLDDGNHCTIRDGGAWPSPKQHPHWVGYYSCAGKDNAVWASLKLRKTGGVHEADPTWTVYTGGVNHTLEKHSVAKALWVGTKHV